LPTLQQARSEGSNESRRPRTLVTAAIATYGTNIAAMVFSLANLVIVARTLGPTGRGQVAFLIAICSVAGMLASLGITDANANLGGRLPKALPRLATNSVLLSLVLGIGAALIVGGLSFLFPAITGHADPVLLVLVLAYLPLGLLGMYLKFLLQSQYRFTITNIAWIASPAATAIIDGVLALCGALTVQTAIICWVSTGVGATLLQVAYTHRHYGFGPVDTGLMRESVSFGLKTHFGRVMSMGNYRADQWILGAMAGARPLGLYSVAVTWSEWLFYVPGVITLVQRPDLVRATRDQAVEQASTVLRRGLVLALGAGGVLFFAAPVLCTTVFGPAFAGSVSELRVLALGAAGIVLLSQLSNAVIAQRKPLLASGADGAALVVTVVLNILLIPHLGGLGAAIATTAAYTFGGVVMTVIFLRVLHGRARDLVPRLNDVAWLWRKMRGELPLLRRLLRPQAAIRGG
jgi:O-antigen/teichoic acid export membrane protein